jgi:uncharacterized protein DUF3592
MLLVAPGLLAAALVWIYIQDIPIRSWIETSGRIVSSIPAARDVRKKVFRTTGESGDTDFITSEMIETKNFADVHYEFSVAGKTYTGSRIDLSVDSGNFHVAEILARYPAGKTVPVFYNPKNPNECILDRDDPKNLRAGWFAVALLVALCVGGVIGVGRLAELVRGAVAIPKLTPLVVALGLFSFFIVIFALMIGQKGRAMRGWSKTRGQIVHSAVEETLEKHNRPGLARDYTQTIYVSRVVYKYDVGGNSYQGDNTGTAVGSNTPALAAKYVARFPLNAMVDVAFNPAVPTESTLDPSTGYIGIVLWTLAALFAAAAFATTKITGGVY